MTWSTRTSATTSPAAYVCYLRATQLAYETSQWTQAVALYEACLQEDPGYAPAWARLARCLRVLAKFGPERAQAMDRKRTIEGAEAAFQRALALDPDLTLAHGLYAQLEVDLGRAEDAMVRLLALTTRRPNAPDLFGGLVHALRFCGLLDASVAAHERARALDPLVPTSIHHTWWMKGEYGKALAETFGDIGYMPGLALASLGNTREAVAALRWRERECPDSGAAVYITSLRALLEGHDEECRRALVRATAQPLDPEARYYLARTYARLGDVDRALEELTRVVEGGFSCHEALDRDPWLEGMRQDGRVRRLIERARSRSARAARAYAQATHGLQAEHV
jgi:tetratricopeptide (TPR) repeat protein